MRKIVLPNPPYNLCIGSGRWTEDGWIGLDKSDYGQEIVWDLRWGIPLPDNSCDKVFADQILEHIQLNEDFVLVMNECLRVLKDGGVMEIHVPYYQSEVAFKDPTHCRYFTKHTFTYLEKDNKWDYGFDKRWKIISCKIVEGSQIYCYLEAQK